MKKLHERLITGSRNSRLTSSVLLSSSIWIVMWHLMLMLRKTGLLTGYQLYHNYFRPHEALNGKTPAEKCGIIIDGENKWQTVIENASMRRF